MPQDFSGQNLRGRSFKGQNLEGANFSGADIRSADFTGANLRGANFSHATAGLQKRWVIGLILISCLISTISGMFLGVFGLVAVVIVTSDIYVNFTTYIVSLIMLIAFWIITIHQGLLAGLGILAMAIAMAAASFISGAILVNTFSSFFIFITLTIAIAFVGAGVIGITGTINIAGAKAVSINVFASGLVIFIAVLSTAGLGAATATVTMPVAVAVFSSYIGWRALKGDEKNAWVCSSAIAFSATGGTSFRRADLTDANFTAATLKSTDFRKAILTRTCFNKTKKLDHVRPGTTYLQNTQLRQLLITGQGQEKNFDRDDLRGVNFQGSNLVDTSFIGADLSQANLQDADLSRAKLVQTQLNGTNLTGATLTGAFIQDWGITTDTKFDGVRCEYVYMRLPTKENPDPLRKPDNNKEVFADGEFGDFIKPIFDTLDLYHNQGVDPRAIAISFKQLAENHPDADLRIVGMEVRGEDKFLLRAKTAATADKSELSAEYFEIYNQLKALAEQEIKALMAEKDSRIRSLENFVNQALQRPSYYSNVEQVGTMTNNPGGFSVGGSVGGNVNNVQGDNNRAVQGDNNQAVLGDGNQVTQQNQVGADTGESLTKEDVVKLLAQLETLIQGAELPADTKEEVIEDLSAAKKATDKEEPNKQRALERLGTVAETLEKTSKGVEAGQKVWTIAKPIIVKVATWLGVAAGSHLLGL